MTAEPVVVLRPGVSVPLKAVEVLWSLQARGVRLWPSGADGALIADPGRHPLTADERAAMKEYREDLIALLVLDSQPDAWGEM